MSMPSNVLGASFVLLVWCLRLEGGEGALNPGDIVYADSGNAVEGGFIVKVDGATGAQSVVSSGGSLEAPFDVAINRDGTIIVSDSGRLIEIEPATGRQTVLAHQPGLPLGSAFGIDIEATGDVVAANARDVVRLDADSGQIELVASGRQLGCPLGVAVAAKNELVIADAAQPPQVVRVNAHNGSLKVVSKGGFLQSPQSIAARGRDIYLTDVATSDGNFGVGRVVHVDAATGRQTVVAEGGYLVGPVGIALEQDGRLIVGDPYTTNPDNRNKYDGAIIGIDPANGRQTLIARGEGARVNPRGVAIVTAPERKAPKAR